MSTMQPVGLLVGRVLLAYLFLSSGLSKIGSFAGTAAYMASKGLPLSNALLVASIIVELGAGLMLALGWKARWAGLALFLWLIPATLIFHAYWAADPAHMTAQMIQFDKNLAIMGGMLYVMVTGSGRYSLDRNK